MSNGGQFIWAFDVFEFFSGFVRFYSEKNQVRLTAKNQQLSMYHKCHTFKMCRQDIKENFKKIPFHTE